MSNSRTDLTSSEIASIWAAYMNDSMAKCVLGFFLKTIEHEEIRPVIQFAYDMAASHLEKLTKLFEEEQLPLPTGFTSEDVNLNAPRLYTDMFMLTYINHMARAGLLAYSGFMSMSARKDIRKYFMEGLRETTDLFDKSTDAALSIGIFVRAPYIAYPTKTDYIDSKKYLSGFSFFNKQRPLNAVEISHLYMNIQTNIMGEKLALSFAQTSPRKEIQEWMYRGSEISKKHVKVFGDSLLEDNIHPPVPPDIALTNSITPPFSDKLTMFLMSFLSAAGKGNYATGAAASQRTDLVLNYERLSLEIAQYAKDGANLMIDNSWLEQPPGTMDKEKLAREKE
ncbi:DUF3231 family protein [Neobacillus sp. NPDC093127]|uniref:DUF3231 family protein n=1 Tax=Neobacillus sp. NPDC093127 TaxID=3364296 RepID=UPI00380DF4C9